MVFGMALFCGGLCTVSGSTPLQMAVPQEQEGVRETPNVEEMAKRMTDRMNEALDLTDEQYEQIYKLNLDTQEEMMKQMADRQPPEGGRPPMPPEGGMPPSDGGRPPMMDNSGMEKMNKKLKEILTDEQYGKWQKIQAERGNGRPAPPSDGEMPGEMPEE